MNDILNRLTVILAITAFFIVAAVGIAKQVEPMVCLFRATVAFVFFGFFGRIGMRVVLKGILEELARHKKSLDNADTEQTGTKSPAHPAAESGGQAETVESE